MHDHIQDLIQNAAPHDNHPKNLRLHILTMLAMIYVPIVVSWIFYQTSVVPWVRSDKAYVGLLCVTWVSFSIGMHTLNKELTTVLDAPGLITAAQMLMAALAMAIFYWKTLLSAFREKADQSRRWLVMPLVFSAMLLSGIWTYKYATLCVLTIVRNLAPLIALPIEFLVMPPSKHPKVSHQSVGAMGIMLCGAIVYGLSAPEISMLGVCFAILNMCIAITDRMIQRRLLSQECRDLELEVCTFISNSLGLFPAMGMALVTHELRDASVHHAADWLRIDTFVLLLLSGLLGLGICYAGLAVQRAISATSFLVLQNISKVAVVSVGISMFGDPIKSNFVIAGLFMSLGGSAWYGKAQLGNSMDAKKSSFTPDEEIKQERLHLTKSQTPNV